MGGSFNPYTRIVLLISELKGNKLADLADVKKCDLAHHAATLRAELEQTPQKGLVDQIAEQAASLLSWIKDGESAKAEEGRLALISSCKMLKDQL
jgi:hypothetical protein